MEKQYRHGDVFLNEVVSVPEGAKEIAKNKAILAYGETTGHAHVLTGAGVKMWNVGTQDYVTVETPSKLAHEEHGVQTIPPGVYEVIHQREYTPKEIRQVRD